MCDIYAASEEPIEGINSEILLEATKKHGQRFTHYIGDVNDMADEILQMVQPNDLVLTLGAGNIVGVGEELLSLLKKH